MKHLKRFENLNTNKPQLGDFVICDENAVSNSESKKFIKSTIGKYIKYLYSGKDIVEDYRYVIEYEDVPFDLRRDSYDFSWEAGSNQLCIRANIKEILMWSSDRKDLERYIDTMKYNI